LEPSSKIPILATSIILNRYSRHNLTNTTHQLAFPKPTGERNLHLTTSSSPIIKEDFQGRKNIWPKWVNCKLKSMKIAVI
jgi:hypothetical protein